MFKNKKFGVFGLGISGVSTIKFLAKYSIDFICFDDQEATIDKVKSNCPEFIHHFKDLNDKAWHDLDYLILSPGIPLNYPTSHKVVQLCTKAKIICDIELLYLINPHAYYIGITGTNGKSTTSSLITHILKYNNYKVALGGNIGVPVLDLPLKNEIYVLEISSFQLDLLEQTKFNIAVLLNITPDHLDRHGSMENYIEAKYKIFNHQSDKDFAIINSSLKPQSNCITFCENNLEADIKIFDNKFYYSNQIYNIPENNSLLGKHNQQNIAAAFACCLQIGLTPEKIIAAIPSFVGLKHRMQYLGNINGVTFINDSKATNADSTDKALDSFNNIIWIVGGVEKEGGISSLTKYFPKIKQALLIGKSSDSFAQTCNTLLNWQKCNNLYNAFEIACQIALPGDTVLLSPACASYDQWKNFEERGEAFIKLVNSKNKK